jgi:hypothetical protein
VRARKREKIELEDFMGVYLVKQKLNGEMNDFSAAYWTLLKKVCGLSGYA